MYIFEDHQHRLLARQHIKLCLQNLQSPLSPLLSIKCQRRMAPVVRQQQQFRYQSRIVGRSFGPGEDRIELVEPCSRYVAMPKLSRMLELPNNRIKGAVGMLRGAEVVQPRWRLRRTPLEQPDQEPRLADSSFS